MRSLNQGKDGGAIDHLASPSKPEAEGCLAKAGRANADDIDPLSLRPIDRDRARSTHFPLDAFLLLASRASASC